ncbi:MAG: transcription termination factor NusA [Anaeroplasmataceae bacterium]
MVSKEFFKQIEEIAKERGLDPEDLINALKKALATSVKRETGKSVRVDINPAKNEILAYTQELVVEAIAENPESDLTQILLEDALKIKKSVKVGDVLEIPVSPKDFARQSARAAKSTFSSDLKALERKKAYDFFKKFEGELITADIVEVTDKHAVINIGQGVTTLLPKSEYLSNDSFQVGDRTSVYVKKVEETTKDPRVYVSRNDRNLVTRLLESYIPEIKTGTIEIKGISRDPGDRCKIAIMSNDPAVDALGTCVGEGGSRIRGVVNALNGEKIDLYKWSENPEELIANSLQPAHVAKVLNVDVKNKTSLAIVPDDQLSLAIGKNGQNVRLAVVSCGWKIDIKPVSEAYNDGLLEKYLFSNDEA